MGSDPNTAKEKVKIGVNQLRWILAHRKVIAAICIHAIAVIAVSSLFADWISNALRISIDWVFVCWVAFFTIISIALIVDGLQRKRRPPPSDSQ